MMLRGMLALLSLSSPCLYNLNSTNMIASIPPNSQSRRHKSQSQKPELELLLDSLSIAQSYICALRPTATGSLPSSIPKYCFILTIIICTSHPPPRYRSQRH
jgi:hypothetical protein